MELNIYKDPETLTHEVANWILNDIKEALQKKDRFTWVLSGGSTPKALHELLATEPYRSQIDWQKIHFFWGDERAVPFEDDRNNAKMAFDTLLNHVPVVSSQIHIMRTDIAPLDAAKEYEKILHEYFPNSQPGAISFDLVLLGMGDDGHTLSLFPGKPVVHEQRLWATAFFLEEQDMFRITLTRPIVNRARKIAFLTTGSKKAHALKEVLHGPRNPDHYPSQVIQPSLGGLYWFVDEAAAAELPK